MLQCIHVIKYLTLKWSYMIFSAAASSSSGSSPASSSDTPYFSPIWPQILEGMPIEERAVAFSKKIESVAKALAPYKLDTADIVSIGAKYDSNVFNPEYTKKTAVETAVSAIFIPDDNEETPDHTVFPGLYLLLKKRCPEFKNKNGSFNQLSPLFHWETESSVKKYVFRNGDIKGLGPYEIEINKALAPYPEHFVSGRFFHYDATTKSSSDSFKKVGAVMEYHENGSMRDCKMHLRRHTTKLEKLEFFYHLAVSIQLLHDLGYVHQDLKPSNIIINNDKKPLLADFGHAKPIGTIVKMGTNGYCSPDIILARKYETGLLASPKDDVWSFGVILAEIFSGVPGDTKAPSPFRIWSTSNRKKEMLNRKRVEGNVRACFPGKSFAFTLIKKCLTHDRIARISMKEVIALLEGEIAVLREKELTKSA